PCGESWEGSPSPVHGRRAERPAFSRGPASAAQLQWPHSTGFNTTFVLTATASGMVSVSAQSPPPTPKARRITVALPVSTGAAPGVQVKVRVTGLLTPRSSRVPSAAYSLPPRLRNFVAL